MFAANLETLLWEHTNGKWWVLAALVTWACAYLWLLSIDAELFSMVVALLLAVIPPFALLALLSLAVTTLFAEPRGWDWAWFAGSLAGVVVLFILMKMEKLPGKTLLERDQGQSGRGFRARVLSRHRRGSDLRRTSARIRERHLPRGKPRRSNRLGGARRPSLHVEERTVESRRACEPCAQAGVA
jgi:hypothetical protein